jgi:hypothetical protein
MADVPIPGTSGVNVNMDGRGKVTHQEKFSRIVAFLLKRAAQLGDMSKSMVKVPTL